MSTRKVSLLGLTSLFFSALALGGDAIPNWPAPATWSLPRGRGATALSETNPLPFQALTPCRLVDTRGTGGVPINTGGKFSANEIRTWTFAGLCGIPASAAAVSLNVTVTGTDSNPFGFVAIWPAGVTEPNVSTLNWSAGGVTESNAAIVPFGTSGNAGKISLQSGNAGSNVIVDVNGYYSDGVLGALAPGEGFTLVGDVSGVTTGLLSVHNTEGVSGARAGYFVADSSGFGSTGLAGIETATSGLTAGVYGQAASSTGKTAGLSGVATSTTGAVYGVYGQSNSTTDGASGVFGAQMGTRATYGVRGVTSSTLADAAGVYGVDGSGDPAVGTVDSAPAGVRGGSRSGIGVVAFSSGDPAMVGSYLNSAGVASFGWIGAPSVGVYFGGGLAGSGTKSFVEPHPTDASKVIRYVSLEGPESGTYFRGRSRFQRGQATIELPEDFRIVTDPESLSIQVMPIGEMASFAVVRIGIEGIIVKGSRDVEFFYTVNGVRRAYNHWEPIQENQKFFVPESPGAKLPKYLSEEERRRLVANGTYNEDGTVNMETAERVGWTKLWADREAQSKAAATANASAHTPQ